MFSENIHDFQPSRSSGVFDHLNSDFSMSVDSLDKSPKSDTSLGASKRDNEIKESCSPANSSDVDCSMLIGESLTQTSSAEYETSAVESKSMTFVSEPESGLQLSTTTTQNETVKSFLTNEKENTMSLGLPGLCFKEEFGVVSSAEEGCPRCISPSSKDLKSNEEMLLGRPFKDECGEACLYSVSSDISGSILLNAYKHEGQTDTKFRELSSKAGGEKQTGEENETPPESKNDMKSFHTDKSSTGGAQGQHFDFRQFEESSVVSQGTELPESKCNGNEASDVLKNQSKSVSLEVETNYEDLKSYVQYEPPCKTDDEDDVFSGIEDVHMLRIETEDKSRAENGTTSPPAPPRGIVDQLGRVMDGSEILKITSDITSSLIAGENNQPTEGPLTDSSLNRIVNMNSKEGVESVENHDKDNASDQKLNMEVDTNMKENELKGPSKSDDELSLPVKVHRFNVLKAGITFVEALAGGICHPRGKHYL